MSLREGDRGVLVRELQTRLKAWHESCSSAFKLVVDGDFGPATADAVEAFQLAKGLYVDGIVGKMTAAALGMPTQADAPREPDPEFIGFKTVYGDVVPVEPGTHAGFRRVKLRADAADSFVALQSAVHAAGAAIPSSGGARPLSASVGSAQSASSWHLPGLAFDLWLPACYRATGPFLIEAEFDLAKERGRWRVFCRAEHGEERTVRAVVASTTFRGGVRVLRLETVDVVAKVIDFTALAASHGWHGIGPRRLAFRNAKRISPTVVETNGHSDALEGWHFQAAGLVPDGTTFGEALQAAYPIDTIERNLEQWAKVRGLRAGKDWL